MVVEFAEAVADLQRTLATQRKERATAPLITSLAKRMRSAFAKQERAFLSRLDAARLRQMASESARLAEAGDVPPWEPLFDEAVRDTEQDFYEALEPEIRAGYAAGLNDGVAELEIEMSFDLDNPRATAFAAGGAAQAVTRINNTTREQLRKLITDAVAEGASYTEIAGQIRRRYEDMRTPQPQLHIRDRAELIAVQEIGESYEGGHYEVGQELQLAGLQMEKSWLTVGDSRVSPDICRPNERQGWIPFNHSFQSGHMRPLGHVACRCTLLQRMAQPEERPGGPAAPPAEPELPQRTPAMVREEILALAEGTELEYERLRGEVLDIYDELDQLQERIDGLVDQSVEHPVGSERWLEIRAEVTELQERRNALLTEKDDIVDRQARLIKDMRERTRELLTVDDPLQVKPEFIGVPDVHTEDTWAAGLDAFAQMVDSDLADPQVVVIRPTEGGGGRAHYDPTIDHIRLGIFDDETVVVHEAGHWLEDMNEQVHELCVGFLMARANANNEHEPEWLGGGYGKHEVAIFDEFIEPYMGKVYGDWFGALAGFYATEIMSMGLEKFYSAPQELAREDPEYFDFIYHVARGEFDAAWNLIEGMDVGIERFVIQQAVPAASDAPGLSPTEPAAPEARVNPEWLERTQEYDEAYWREFEETLPEALGVDSWEEAKALVEESLAEQMELMDVYTRVSSLSLRKILEDGRLKSQFETGTSGGLFDPDLRASAEEALFGYDAEETDPTDRPIYGYLAPSGEDINGDPAGGSMRRSQIDQYGPFAIRFKPEVERRTTWTGDDSLAGTFRGKFPTLTPSAMDSPLLESLHRVALDYIVEHGLPEEGTSNHSDVLRRWAGWYLEAQVHGGLSVDDIAEVIVRADEIPNIPAWEKTVKALERAGIPLVIVE